VVLEADDVGGLPISILALPERSELCFSCFIIVPGVAKTMKADLTEPVSMRTRV
jgi:hypothetical protein